MKTSLLLLLLLVPLSQALAVDLFGVDLATTERDAMRDAVKTAGLNLISEAGDDAFFDSYESDSVLPSSTRLYLGFVKEDRKFAFAEYEFAGFKHPVLKQKLIGKYGQPSVETGQFLTDQAYVWKLDDVEIALRIDWPNYKTRLVYSIPQQLARLAQERALFQSQTGEVPLVFNEAAY